MFYRNITEGIFLERLHRFGALADINGVVEYVHVKNTGRCREILIPGVRIYLEKSNNPDRKTKYSLISVYKGKMLINIDSQVPNAVVHEALATNQIDDFADMKKIKREAVFGRSRFDIYFESQSGIRGFIEIKGVTLEDRGMALFPDAPTVRGRKHLIELADAAAEGYSAHAFFLIQFRPAVKFQPNRTMDPAFADALKHAVNNGVKIHAFDSFVTRDEIKIGSSVPIELI